MPHLGVVTAVRTVAPPPWDVVRISHAIASNVVLRLLERGIPLGPIWQNRARGVIEAVVPPGTAAHWPRLDTQWVTCAPLQGINCPPPDGRRWITRPSDTGRPPATDPDALCEAVTAAIARARLNRRPAAVRPRSRPGRSTLPRPHPGSEMHRYSPFDLRADLGELGAARRHVRTTLAGWYVPAHTADAAVLVAHELLVNAVEHGDGETVSVCLFLESCTLTVIVGNVGTLRQPLAPRPLTTTSEGGRGLHVVAEYADTWDHYATRTRVVVWADFQLDHYKEQSR